MATYTDAFTNTNGTDLNVHNAAWVQGTGSSVLEIQGNACAGLADATPSFYRYNQTFASAHYSRAKRTAAGDHPIGPSVRCQAAADSHYYCFAHDPTGVTYTGQRVAGTDTDWDSGQTIPSIGQVFGLEIDETTTTTIYYKVAGSTVATYTSKSALSGGQAGVGRYSGADTAARIDDWEGGDIGGAAVAWIHSTIIRQAGNRASTY